MKKQDFNGGFIVASKEAYDLYINNMEDLDNLPIPSDEMLSDDDYVTRNFKDEICKCSEFKLICTDDKNRIRTTIQPTQDNFEFEIIIKTKVKE